MITGAKHVIYKTHIHYTDHYSKTYSRPITSRHYTTYF